VLPLYVGHPLKAGNSEFLNIFYMAPLSNMNI
jgi:hypothetical protein